MLRTLAAAAIMVAAVTAMAVGPALADPVTGSGKAVRPAVFDLVGVGSDTTQDLTNQISIDYNGAHATHNNSRPHIYSWDATNPKTQAIGDLISTKTGCTKISRPNGSGAGITELQLDTVDPKSKSHLCVDYARSASGRSTQATGKGGVLFVALAQDGVTYASQQNSNAPTSLTTAQLTKIYSCAVTRWNQVGGKSNATIQAYLPPPTSGVRTFFLKVINVTAPGPCVNKLGTPEQNEGTSKLLKTANAIFPYSIGDFISQKFHSAQVRQEADEEPEHVRLRPARHAEAELGQQDEADERQRREDHDQPQVQRGVPAYPLQRGALVDRHQGPHPGPAGPVLREEGLLLH